MQTFVQRLEYPNPRTFVGKGKLDEIKRYIDDNDIGMVIFADHACIEQTNENAAATNKVEIRFISIRIILANKIVFLRHAVRKPCNECLQQGMLERWRSAKCPVRLPFRCLNSRKHRCEVSLKQAGLLTYLSPWAGLPASAQMACSG